jgi:hypothetical protein
MSRRIAAPLLEPVGKPLAGSRRPASPLAALSSVDAQNQCASLLRLASGARMRRSLIDDGFTNRLLQPALDRQA